MQEGQVLWLRMRFNNEGVISRSKHPYLILDIQEDYVEVGQLDSVEGKEWKVAYESNKLIKNKNPKETVIEKDSFIQMDNKFTIEFFGELESYKRTEDKLSEEKLNEIKEEYKNYQNNHHLDENKQVYMTKDELEKLNK